MQIQRYVGKISGPLMDRIDIHIDVPAVKFNELRGRGVPQGDSSDVIRERVIAARDIQLARFNGDGIYSNSAMSPRQIRTFCTLDQQSEDLLEIPAFFPPPPPPPSLFFPPPPPAPDGGETLPPPPPGKR